MVRRLALAFTAHLDGLLLAFIGMLVCIGIAVLYSASGESLPRLSGQLVNLAVAFTVMWLATKIPPNHLMHIALPAYLFGSLLLVGVELFGDITNGAQRWLDLGFVRIQPSELMKIAIPMVLAWYFHRYEGALKVRHYAIATAVLLVPVVLILHQPDLGTALLIAASGFYVLFLAGLSWRIIGGLALAGIAAAPVIWNLMHDYQRRRVLTLLDPTQDPLGAGYHIIQSTIAVGSGGLAGKGWLNGTQTHLDFLPERTTDFIFAVFSEEFGLIGNILLLVLYLAVIARCMVITANAPTTFARLLAGALTLEFFTYAFVNMGMVSGILPVVGVPLPLISYGGTSLVTICLGFGILMSIQTHRKLIQT